MRYTCPGYLDEAKRDAVSPAERHAATRGVRLGGPFDIRPLDERTVSAGGDA